MIQEFWANSKIIGVRQSVTKIPVEGGSDRFVWKLRLIFDTEAAAENALHFFAKRYTWVSRGYLRGKKIVLFQTPFDRAEASCIAMGLFRFLEKVERFCQPLHNGVFFPILEVVRGIAKDLGNLEI